MASPVIVEWIVKGIPDVQRASRTVQDTVLASERASTRAAEQESKKRISLADAEARMKVQALKSSDREIQRIKEGATRTAERAMANEVRAFERAEQEKNRIASRWVEQRVREEASALAKANATRQRFASAIAGKAVSGFATGVGRVAGIAGQVGGMVSQLGGGFSIADSVQRGVSLKGKLSELSNKDQMALGPGGAGRIGTGSIEKKVRSVGAEFGISADTGADALDKFAGKTGKLQLGMDMLRGLAEISRAGAGSLDDLGSAAAEVFNADKTQSAEQVLNKLRQFSVQGAKGAVEMKDMANGLAAITASAGRFEGGADKEMLTFGALAQLAKEKGGAKGPAQALTAVQSLANQFGKNARVGKMNEMGVDPKTAAGFNRPVEDVLMDMMLASEKQSRKKGKGLHDFDQIFGTGIADAQAKRATNPLTDAFKAAGGGAAGIAAAKKELAGYGAGNRDLKTEFAGLAKTRTGDADAQMEIVKQKFDEAVSTKIIPKLLDLMPVLEKLIPQFVDLAATGIPAFASLIKSVGEFAETNKGIISTLAAHPFAAIIGASLAKSAGSEIISKMAGSALSGLLGRLGGGGGGGGAGGGAGGVGAALGAGALAGAATYALTKPSIDALLDGQTAGQAETGSLTSSLKRGSASEKAAALAAYDAMEARSGGAKGAARLMDNSMKSPFASIYSAVTGEPNKVNASTKQTMKDSEVLANKELQNLVAALRANTAATLTNGGGATVRNPTTPITQRPNQ